MIDGQGRRIRETYDLAAPLRQGSKGEGQEVFMKENGAQGSVRQDAVQKSRRVDPAVIFVAVLMVILLAAFVVVTVHNKKSVSGAGKDSLYQEDQLQQPSSEPGGDENAEQNQTSGDAENGTTSNASNGLQAVSDPAQNYGLYGAETPGASNIVAEYEGKQLNNQAFLYYYWDMFFNFYSAYGDYLAYYLSMSTPFDQQSYSETETWHDYFVEMAASNWMQTELICSLAEQEGYQLTEADEEYMTQTMESLKEYAEENGYGTSDGYLRTIFDPSAETDSYEQYLRRGRLANSYASARYQRFYDEVYDPDAELSYCINVRHILIMPEEGSEIADADAAQKRAEELYAQFLQNPTEENFAEMAGEYSDDTGSVSNGGLYTDVQPGDMITEFNDWCFDESRQPGDHEIIQTSYGSHIMYFVGESETAYSDPNADAAGEKYNAWLDELFTDQQPEIFNDEIVFTLRAELVTE